MFDLNKRYIIYNACFGGYEFSFDFFKEVFQRFPPSLNKEQTLFRLAYSQTISLDEYMQRHFFDDYYFLIEKERETCDEFPYYIFCKTTESIYDIDLRNETWRTNMTIIGFLFEKIQKKLFNGEKPTREFYKLYAEFSMKIGIHSNKKTVTVVDGSSINITNITFSGLTCIRDNVCAKFNVYDEKYIVFADKCFKMEYNSANWYTDVNLLNYMLFKDINGTHASLGIIEIPDGFEWKIREYDGAESIIFSLPKDQMIKELLELLKQNKVSPNESTSPLIKELVLGEKTTEDLEEMTRNANKNFRRRF